jgi:hypothetical protein
VIEVEQRALGTLEEDVVAARERRLHEPRRVVEVVAKPRTPAERLVDECVGLEGLGAHPGEQPVLVGQDALDPLAQDAPVEEVLHPKAEPPGTIAIRRADASTRRPHRGIGEACLVAAVEGHVVRHDHVRAPADAHARDIDAALGEHVELGDQRQRVHDDAVADHRGHVRVEHARRRETQLEHLVAADDGVAGVVATLVADDHRGPLREEVRRLALAFVTPLEPDDDRGRHQQDSGTSLATA